MKVVYLILTAILLVGNAGAWIQATPAVPPPATLRVAFVTPDARQPTDKEDAVIFADDFAGDADRAARYFEYSPENGSFVWKAEEGMGAHRGAMRAQFERDQVSAGALRVLFGKSPFGNKGIRPQETFREIYWRVYVKQEAGWTGNPAKLARATCLATPDWSQGFIGHVWGGKGLENYWNDGAVKRETRWFSDFVISTKPIGPIVAASPPTFTCTGKNIARWEAQAAADPEGKDIVWTSAPIEGKVTALSIDAAHGTFAGSRDGQHALEPGQTYWVRLRQIASQSSTPGESAWSLWHAPFRIARPWAVPTPERKKNSA